MQKAMIGVCVAAAALVTNAAPAAAQDGNPRFGRWKLRSEAPPPASNIMTYEPYGGTGMKITVDSVNARGETSQWWYTTMFDGREQPITGNRNADTGTVRVVSDRITEIIYRKDGRVAQLLTNVLSPDGNTIGVMFMRQAEDGRTSGVTLATYERIR